MENVSGPSFAIEFADLWTDAIGPAGDSERGSLSQLAGAGEHIHGRLEIRVDGRCLPSLGYFGPDDVCLNEWVRALTHLRTAITGDGETTYLYDEGEQGQPGYHFAKVGDEVVVSVRDGIGGGRADPEWLGVACQAVDVVDAIAAFSRQLESAVISAAGKRGREWLAAVVDE